MIDIIKLKATKRIYSEKIEVAVLKAFKDL